MPEGGQGYGGGRRPPTPPPRTARPMPPPPPPPPSARRGGPEAMETDGAGLPANTLLEFGDAPGRGAGRGHITGTAGGAAYHVQRHDGTGVTTVSHEEAETFYPKRRDDFVVRQGEGRGETGWVVSESGGTDEKVEVVFDGRTGTTMGVDKTTLAVSRVQRAAEHGFCLDIAIAKGKFTGETAIGGVRGRMTGQLRLPAGTIPMTGPIESTYAGTRVAAENMRLLAFKRDKATGNYVYYLHEGGAADAEIARLGGGTHRGGGAAGVDVLVVEADEGDDSAHATYRGTVTVRGSWDGMTLRGEPAGWGMGNPKPYEAAVVQLGAWIGREPGATLVKVADIREIWPNSVGARPGEAAAAAEGRRSPSNPDGTAPAAIPRDRTTLPELLGPDLETVTGEDLIEIAAADENAVITMSGDFMETTARALVNQQLRKVQWGVMIDTGEGFITLEAAAGRLGGQTEGRGVKARTTEGCTGGLGTVLEAAMREAEHGPDRVLKEAWGAAQRSAADEEAAEALQAGDILPAMDMASGRIIAEPEALADKALDDPDSYISAEKGYTVITALRGLKALVGDVGWSVGVKGINHGFMNTTTLVETMARSGEHGDATAFLREAGGDRPQRTTAREAVHKAARAGQDTASCVRQDGTKETAEDAEAAQAAGAAMASKGDDGRRGRHRLSLKRTATAPEGGGETAEGGATAEGTDQSAKRRAPGVPTGDGAGAEAEWGAERPAEMISAPPRPPTPVAPPGPPPVPPPGAPPPWAAHAPTPGGSATGAGAAVTEGRDGRDRWEAPEDWEGPAGLFMTSTANTARDTASMLRRGGAGLPTLTDEVIWYYSTGGEHSWLSSMSACAFRARATSPDIWPGWLRPLQGRLFSTREHFFVAAKFMWNGASPESPGVQAVLQAATGFEALRLGKAGGRELRNFDTVGWDAEGRLRAMEVAALQQVITNGQFRARLLGTGDAWLAEAKSENFWGIGATLDKVQLMETGEWRALRGQNWHGRILMAARGLARRGSDALPRQETA